MIEFFSNPLISQIVGFFVGLITSFISWWLLFHYFSPKIKFSSQILKSKRSLNENNKSGYDYFFKFANVGNRNINELSIKALISRAGLWSNVTIYSAKVYEIFEMIPSKNFEATWTLRLTPNESESYLFERYVGGIKEKRENKTLLLEDILSMNLAGRAKLVIFISCVDSFSGSKKYFKKVYYIEDIAVGRYKKRSLELNPGI